MNEGGLEMEQEKRRAASVESSGLVVDTVKPGPRHLFAPPLSDTSGRSAEQREARHIQRENAISTATGVCKLCRKDLLS